MSNCAQKYWQIFYCYCFYKYVGSIKKQKPVGQPVGQALPDKIDKAGRVVKHDNNK